MAYMKDLTGRRLDKFRVADTRGITGVPTVKPLIPAVDKVGPPSIADGIKSDGTNIHAFYRAMHKLLTTEKITMVQMQYGNYYTPGFAGEVVGDNDISIRAGVETADGIITPATFAGQRDITLKPGQVAWTDPIVIQNTGGPSGGTVIWSRSLVQVATLGQKWYYTNILQGAAGSARPGESWEGNSTAWTTDKTVTGTFTNYPNGRGGYGFGPLAILCETADTKPVVGILGDSIARGHQDGDVTRDGFVTNGFLSRALLTAKIPYSKIAVAGDRAVNWLDRTISYRRRGLLNGLQHVICEYGHNDLDSGNRTPAQVEADLLKVWAEMGHQGAKVWQTTITAASTSTDGWATTANQTTMANEANRVTVNTWIRAGAPIDPTTKAAVAVGTPGALVAGSDGHPLAGYFEVADAVESARNSGKWKPALRSVTDAAITTGTATLTSATAAFTSADVGRSIVVTGAGGSGGLLLSMILSVNSATSVTLSGNASTTVSGAALAIGTYTPDGLHPNTDGYIAMAAAVDTTKFA